MTVRTIREILPGKIVQHYEKFNRFADIEWVSINEAYTVANIRLSNGLVECWTNTKSPSFRWHREPRKDKWVR